MLARPLLRGRLSPCPFQPQFGRSIVSESTKFHLQDKFGRVHDYLRISITDRCNLRCKYCMPSEGIELAKRESYLNFDELKRLVDIFVLRCGIKKVRLTGGEPTIDRKCSPLLDHLNGLREHGLATIAMTTNGLSLKRHAKMLKSQGLNSVNISLDTLKEERFESLTRRRGWRLAHDGLLAALEAGFDQVKLNCVVMRGFNEDEIGDFLQLASRYPIEVRFIEFMPFLGNNWMNERLVTSGELLADAKRLEPDLKEVRSGQDRHATSRVYTSPSMHGSIGFISSMSENFCSGCNRLRLTSDGQLKVCLFGTQETSLRDLIRFGATDDEILKAISRSLEGKKLKHAGADILQRDSIRPMIRIGQRFSHNSSSGSSRAPVSFSHLDQDGQIAMVNVGSKPAVKRVAVARGRIEVGQEVLSKIHEGAMTKGNVLGLSRVAGIMGAKMTSRLIPLCHQVPLDHVQVNIEQCNQSSSLVVTASVQAHHNTGVEMESLTAVSITLLAIYDMCKSVNKSMIISDIELLSKRKGS